MEVAMRLAVLKSKKTDANSCGYVSKRPSKRQYKYKKSLADAKGNARQRCMFEGLVRTKSKLTDPSNDVSFTLARELDRFRAAVLVKNRQFFYPPSVQRPRWGWFLLNLWKICIFPETRVFQAADGEDLVILARTVFDWSTRVTDEHTDRIAMAKRRYTSSCCRA